MESSDFSSVDLSDVSFESTRSRRAVSDFCREQIRINQRNLALMKKVE